MFVAIELGNWQAAIVLLYFLYYSTDEKKIMHTYLKRLHNYIIRYIEYLPHTGNL